MQAVGEGPLRFPPVPAIQRAFDLPGIGIRQPHDDVTDHTAHVAEEPLLA